MNSFLLVVIEKDLNVLLRRLARLKMKFEYAELNIIRSVMLKGSVLRHEVYVKCHLTLVKERCHQYQRDFKRCFMKQEHRSIQLRLSSVLDPYMILTLLTTLHLLLLVAVIFFAEHVWHKSSISYLITCHLTYYMKF